MSHFDEDMDDASLSPDERRELAALPREHVASAALEERIVGALREARAFGPRAMTIRRSALRHRGWTTAAACAASVAIFLSGILVGRSSAHAEQVTVPSQQSREAVRRGADSMQLAHEVQRAGSEYVQLLERLPSRSPVDSAPSQAVLLGREAARSTLHAAARQLARVSPNDPVAMLLVEGLRSDPRGGQVLWF